MTKAQLVAISLVRDILDFTPVGHIPILDQVLDLPVIYLHYKYADKRALLVAPELVPLVGVLPIFTVCALSYP
jgi:hypothetical protein